MNKKQRIELFSSQYMKTYSPESWHEMTKTLYELILEDMQNASDDILPEIYPKLIIMYEFFRLVRGEAFHTVRPAGMEALQDEIFKMENDLSNRLMLLKKKLDVNDSKTAYYLELMKKSFDLK